MLEIIKGVKNEAPFMYFEKISCFFIIHFIEFSFAVFMDLTNILLMVPHCCIKESFVVLSMHFVENSISIQYSVS